MDISVIGAASTAMAMAQTQQAVGVTMTRKAMDMQETQAAALIETMQQASPAPATHLLDARA